MAPPAKLTHFLCIPLVTPHSRPQLQASLSKFRAEANSAERTLNHAETIPQKAIRPPGTIHLTIGVMSLPTPERVKSAVTLLKSLDLKKLLDQSSSPATRGAELRVTLRGLTTMSRQKPSETSMLYSPPTDEDGRLQSFGQKLWEIFKDAGYLVNESRPLLLHATIVNTVYVPNAMEKGTHGRNRARLMIDARDFIEMYEDFTWMRDVRVEKIAVCQMGEKKVEGGDAEYLVEGEARLP